jgi:hypothetical protein
LRGLYTWARLSLASRSTESTGGGGYDELLASYCSITFPLIDCYCQYEKEKNVRMKKKKRKKPLPMSALWKKSEVMSYGRSSWMSTDAQMELSRLTYALCSHLTHLHEAFTLDEIWLMIQTLEALERAEMREQQQHQEGEEEGEEGGGTILRYLREYKLDWIFNSFDQSVLTQSLTVPSFSSSSSATSFPPRHLFKPMLPHLPPPGQLEEQVSVGIEDIRMIQNKAQKKRRYSDLDADPAHGKSNGHPLAQPLILSSEALLSSREVQEILHHHISPPPPTATDAPNTSSASSVLELNKEFLQAASALSLVAGKSALKLLSTPDDGLAANLLLREYNSLGREYLSYETAHTAPFERLHLRQLLK